VSDPNSALRIDKHYADAWAVRQRAWIGELRG
jgi:hypothetical protein